MTKIEQFTEGTRFVVEGGVEWRVLRRIGHEVRCVTRHGLHGYFTEGALNRRGARILVDA